MTKTIIIEGVEYETELHTDMNEISKIVIPEGWRLMTLAEFLNIYNNHFELFNWETDKYADEIVQQPIKDSEKEYPYWNVWLRGLVSGDRSELGGDRDLYCSSRVRGVRFCRDVKK